MERADGQGAERAKDTDRLEPGDVDCRGDGAGVGGEAVDHLGDGVITDRDDQQVCLGKIGVPIEHDGTEAPRGGLGPVGIPRQHTDNAMVGGDGGEGEGGAGPPGADEKDVHPMFQSSRGTRQEDSLGAGPWTLDLGPWTESGAGPWTLGPWTDALARSCEPRITNHEP